MASLNRTFKTAAAFITHPSEAARECTTADAFAIYLFSVLAHSLFYFLKPAYFPAESAQALSGNTPVFTAWFFAEGLWGTVFLASWLLFLTVFLRILSSGRLSLRFFTAVLLTASTVLLTVVRPGGGIFSFMIWICVLSFSAYTASKDKPLFVKTSRIILAINIIPLVFIPVLSAAVILRSETGYMTAQVVSAFWTIGIFANSVKTITDTTTARALFSILFSFTANSSLIFAAHFAGILPEEIFKILLAP